MNKVILTQWKEHTQNSMENITCFFYQILSFPFVHQYDYSCSPFVCIEFRVGEKEKHTEWYLYHFWIFFFCEKVTKTNRKNAFRMGLKFIFLHIYLS